MDHESAINIYTFALSLTDSLIIAFSTCKNVVFTLYCMHAQIGNLFV